MVSSNTGSQFTRGFSTLVLDRDHLSLGSGEVKVRAREVIWVIRGIQLLRNQFPQNK